MTKKKNQNSVKTKKQATKKIQEFSDGKNHIEEEANYVRGLESMIGRPKRNVFGSESLEEFEGSVANMQLSQMQELAVKAGVFPSGTKVTLKNKLIKAYKQHTQGSMNCVQVTKPIVEPGSDQEKELLKILNQ
jgi:hypothetical protein